MTKQHSGPLTSPEYLEILRATHAKRPWGRTGRRHVESFMPMFRELDCTSLLDYGSGTESVRKALERDHPEVDVRCYDPGVLGREQLPEPADFVVCLDVLEHVEPDLIDNVLVHIYSLVLRGCYFCIALGPAKRCLADGRNRHILIRPRSWWLDRLQVHRFKVVKLDGHRKFRKNMLVWVKV